MLDEATLPETKDSIPVKPSLDQPTLNHPDLDQIQQAHLRQLLEEIRAVRRRHDNDEDRDDDSFDDDDDEADRESDGDAKYVELRTPDLPRMTCPICFENTYLQASPCCSYASCLSCWRAHIASALSDGRVTVNCVSLDCTKHLPRETILDIIRTDQALSDRYARLYTILNQNPRSKTCPRCSHLYSLDTLPQKHSSKKLPKQVQCSQCSLVWCFRCQAPWHENLTCKQYLKGDRLLHKWMKQRHDDQWNARKCPKCSSYIQRAGGCPHMTCRSCSCEFCYSCGRRYVKVPLIGQHSSRFSIFGCPYNLAPERPWLRRTIRGSIATGVVVASPLILAGVTVAAVTVLPPVGIYRLTQHIRRRRAARRAQTYMSTPPIVPTFDELDAGELPEYQHFYGETLAASAQELGLLLEVQEEQENEENPFALMDVENLFVDRASSAAS